MAEGTMWSWFQNAPAVSQGQGRLPVPVLDDARVLCVFMDVAEGRVSATEDGPRVRERCEKMGRRGTQLRHHRPAEERQSRRIGVCGKGPLSGEKKAKPAPDRNPYRKRDEKRGDEKRDITEQTKATKQFSVEFRPFLVPQRRHIGRRIV